jgi:hypothetical protein
MWLFPQERYEEGEAVNAALMGKDISHHDVQLQKTIILDSSRAYVLLPFPAHLSFANLPGRSSQARKNTPLSAIFTGGKTQHFRWMLLGASTQFFSRLAAETS